MSNVLIGIIGVILFIGLALAGALFLGPRFQESTNNSRASAAVQAVSQVANAANMYQVQEGKSDYSTTNLVSGGYLKVLPSNPTSSTDAPAIGTGVVTMKLGTNASAVCAAIAKQTSGATTTPATQPANATAGCYGDATAGFNAFATI